MSIKDFALNRILNDSNTKAASNSNKMNDMLFNKDVHCASWDLKGNLEDFTALRTVKTNKPDIA